MAIETTYQRVCDRCGAEMGDASEEEIVHDLDHPPILSIEAEAFGVPLKTMQDVCDDCRKLLPSLLEQVVSVVVETKKAK
jgi:hypothetical protein